MKAEATSAPRGGLLERLQVRGMVTAAASWSAAQKEDLGAAAPERLAQPENPEALRELVIEAGVAESPLLMVGGGTALGGGHPLERADLAVSTRGLARIVEHSASDFVVAVEAGCRLADLQRELAPHRQWVAIEPPDPERATIGGLIATAATSLVASGHGTLRNHLLGVRVLQADARFAKAGGRVVKNVAGYDLMKMNHGALGAFGVLVAATLRLRPLPAADLVTWTEVEEGAPIVACAEAIAAPGFLPAGAHFVGAIVPHGPGAPARISGDVVFRFQGARAAVLDQAGAIAARLAGKTSAWRREVLDETQRLRPRPLSHAEIVGARGDEAGTASVSLHFRPSRLAELLAALQRLGFGQVMVELLRGSGWLKLALGAMAAGDARLAAIGQLRRDVEALGGTIALHGGPPALRSLLAPFASSEGTTRLITSLKHELDPRRLLHRGRLGAHA